MAPALRPTRLDELQDAILEANARGERLEIVGHATKAAVGAPAPEAQRLDLNHFNALIDYDPAELVLTAGAAAPLAEIEALLEGHGQMLAFEPMDYGALFGAEDGGTLGGMVSANASGPRRPVAGAARDHFLGLTAVSGRGDLFKGGGKVVKNVTGYDVPKLLAGAWGTLAAMTEVTLKVLPRPRTEATALIAGLTDAEACRAMSLALGAPAGVTAAAHLPAGLASRTPGLAGAAGALTVLRLEGVEPSIRSGFEVLRERLDSRALDRLEPADSRALWRHLRDAGPLAADPRPLWRVSVPPADGWQAMQALAGDGFEGFYDWAGGLLWIAAEAAADAGAEAVRAAARHLGGHATLIRAPAAVRAAVPVFQPEPQALAALSARVKAAFDPRGVLNPRHRLAPPAGA